jgi:hypothetical protein
MSLPAKDPDRRAAETHALACAACAAALAEAGAVMELVDRALPLPSPGSLALARARQGVLDRIAREPPRALGAAGIDARPVIEVVRGERPAGARVLGVFTAVLVASWLGATVKHLVAGPSSALSALMAAAAIGAGVTALRWGAAWLALLAVGAVAFVAADAGRGGLAPGHGAECAAFELALALLPLGSVLAFARRGRAGAPVFAAAAAAAAGAGALVAQAALHVACHVSPSTSHALVFHAGPVLVALAAGAAAGGFVRRQAGAR